MNNKLIGLLVFIFFTVVSKAQVRDTLTSILPYDQPKEYEIGGIRVVGSQFADPNAIISLSGLRVGEKIRIPGQQVTKAVRTLWDLKLFTDVEVLQERTQGNIVFLEIKVKELPRYMRHSFIGVKKSKHDDLNEIINKYIQKGTILTNNSKASLKYALENYFVEKGYRAAQVSVKEFPDERSVNGVRLEFDIQRGKRVKISDITFSGNNNVKARVLRKKMKGTARTREFLKSQNSCEKNTTRIRKKLKRITIQLGLEMPELLRIVFGEMIKVNYVFI